LFEVTSRAPGQVGASQRDSDAWEGGRATTTSSGTSSAWQSVPSPTPQRGTSLTCLPPHRDPPGTPLRAACSARDEFAGNRRHSQEGRP
jgi:hypothetical protein